MTIGELKKQIEQLPDDLVIRLQIRHPLDIQRKAKESSMSNLQSFEHLALLKAQGKVKS